MNIKVKVLMFLSILMLIIIHIVFLANIGIISTQALIVLENILGFIFKLIMVILLIILLGLAIFLFGSIMCDLGIIIKKTWLCKKFVERAITKRSLERLKRSNLVLFLLGEYLRAYKFDISDEVEREVRKYKYLISDGISATIYEIFESMILFWRFNKEKRVILKKVLKENKEKLDSVDFNKIEKVIKKLAYVNLYWKEKIEYTTIGIDYKYNDENYYKYFSKSPVLPESKIFDDFDFIKCRNLNEMIEVVDNPEEEFPLYIDPFELMRLHYKNMK